MFVFQGFIQTGLQHGKNDLVFLNWTLNGDAVGQKNTSAIVSKGFVGNVGEQLALLAINELTMGQQVDAAEDNAARKKPAIPRNAGSPAGAVATKCQRQRAPGTAPAKADAATAKSPEALVQFVDS